MNYVLRLMILAAALALTGCARFEPRQLSAADRAARLEARSLESAGLKSFLEKNLGREMSEWPAPNWDLEMLRLAAFYYHPSLELARAQWAVAKGGEMTAGQRPNPTLNVTPGYNATTFMASPWLPLGSLDIPVETAGKRRYRRARSAQVSEAARLNIASVAWQVRSDLKGRLIEFAGSRRREALLEGQLANQERSIALLEQRLQAGAISSSEVALSRVALEKTRLDLSDAQRQGAEARTRVAEAIGV